MKVVDYINKEESMILLNIIIFWMIDLLVLKLKYFYLALRI
jgi:hypothetical protein